MRKGSVSLAHAAPSVASEWHPTRNDTAPNDVASGAHQVAWWICQRGHEWEAQVKSRAHGGYGCPFCAGQRPIPGETDLATTHPELAAQWHPSKNGPLTPVEVMAASPKPRWWVCAHGHEWQAGGNARVKGIGCPYCSGRLPIPGETDLATTHPDIAAQWHPTKNGGLSPRDVKAGTSSTKPWWLCARGHEWQTPIPGRTGRNGGCPYCSGRLPIPGETDLATTHPDIAAQWHPTKNGDLSPRDVKAGTDRKAWWVCAAEHEWDASIASRRTSACPYCSNKAVLAGFNDLGTTHPDLAAQWHPTKNGDLTPAHLTAGAEVAVWWVCPNDPEHEWEAWAYSRKSGNGCPHCWTGVSGAEGEIADLLELLAPGIEIRRNDRVLCGDRREVDLVLPEHRLAIEYNGVYWHSEAYKGREAHQSKAAALRAAGYRLLVIWEDEWNNEAGPYSRQIVVRSIAHRLGVTARAASVLPDSYSWVFERVGARSLSVGPVDASAAADFLLRNHIQGPVVSATSYGLRDKEGRLRAVLAIKRAKRKGTWEIVRYATAGIIPGGFTRLLKHATVEIGRSAISTWVTFADHSVSDGALYSQNGFVADRELPPDYTYRVGHRREHKFAYRKKRFESDPRLVFDPSLTERELADLNGLGRVWDYGKTRYVLDLD